MLKVGLIGKPNAGKSTLFSAITSIDVEIANYPFTTVKPNIGISFIKDACPETEIKAHCNPREGKCIEGVRYVPVEIIDVPGLIEGASEGKGMGNEFLDNIRDADLIINLFDSAENDDVTSQNNGSMHGVNLIKDEILKWMKNKIYKDWQKFSRKEDMDTEERIESKILKRVATFGLNEKDIFLIMNKDHFSSKLFEWSEDDIFRFCGDILTYVKPMFNVGNKADIVDNETVDKINEKINTHYFISAEYELIIEKAFTNGYIDKDSLDFSYTNKSGENQKKVLEKMKEDYKTKRISRFFDVLTDIINKLGYIIIYPVLDENKWTDKNGNILPDAFLLKDGDTALDLAYRIHTDIGKNFIRAVNCRTKRIVGKDYKLLNNDVIKIISNSR